jgi:trans-aconitate methyltransferase
MAESGLQTWNTALYDNQHAFVWKYGAALIELLAPQPEERILDLGCGTGHLTAQIAAAGAQVLGIDASPEMVAEARRNHPPLRFETADARSFEFGSDFDAVFSNAVLHWVQPPEQAVRKIAAALRPGGRFVAEFGGKGNTQTIIGALLAEGARRGIAELVNPWYFPGIPVYAALLESHGFEVTFATLFDRWTVLEGETGLRNWYEMFAGRLLDRFPSAERESVLATLEQQLRPALYCDGQWRADYRRLRIVATKRIG